jgi:hypothetical protein
MTMKFIQVVPEPNPAPITPESGAVSVMSTELDGVDDGAVAIANVTVQGLGPNRSRVTATLVGHYFSSNVIDKAIVDVEPGAMARIHLSGAANLVEGSATYEIFVSVENGMIRIDYIDNDEKPMSKLIVFGGFANGA